jgi:hypothetical protein
LNPKPTWKPTWKPQPTYGKVISKLII